MADSQPPKRRLGRGLDALLGGFSERSAAPPERADSTPVPTTASAPPAPVATPVADSSNAAGNESQTAAPAEPVASSAASDSDRHLIPVDSIKRNPFQPRSDFDEQSLEELAASIRTHGVLQPVLVRRVDDSYQLIAGERRWLASQKAGLTEIPCRIMDLDNRQVSEAAIEENLKRKDLNVLEKAQAFQDYLDRFGCTMEELGRRLSMDRSTVSNMLRLLELPEPVKRLLQEEKISGGHAKAILPLEEADQLAVCDRIQAEGLSVRKTEQAVRSILRGGSTPDTIPMKSPSDAKPDKDTGTAAENLRTPHIESLEQQLRGLVGLKVEIRLKTKESGQMIVQFDSNADFERLTRFLRKAA